MESEPGEAEPPRIRLFRMPVRVPREPCRTPSKSVPWVSRNQCEGRPVEWTHGAEVPLIERQQPRRSVPCGEHRDGGVGQAEPEIRVPLNAGWKGSATCIATGTSSCCPACWQPPTSPARAAHALPANCSAGPADPGNRLRQRPDGDRRAGGGHGSPARHSWRRRRDRLRRYRGASLVRPRLTTVSNRPLEHGQVCTRSCLAGSRASTRGRAAPN
jgi:hypothetical protein